MDGLGEWKDLGNHLGRRWLAGTRKCLESGSGGGNLMNKEI